MKCLNCNHENAETSRFCKECGSSLFSSSSAENTNGKLAIKYLLIVIAIRYFVVFALILFHKIIGPNLAYGRSVSFQSLNIILFAIPTLLDLIILFSLVYALIKIADKKIKLFFYIIIFIHLLNFTLNLGGVF